MKIHNKTPISWEDKTLSMPVKGKMRNLSCLKRPQAYSRHFTGKCKKRKIHKTQFLFKERNITCSIYVLKNNRSKWLLNNNSTQNYSVLQCSIKRKWKKVTKSKTCERNREWPKYLVKREKALKEKEEKETQARKIMQGRQNQTDLPSSDQPRAAGQDAKSQWSWAFLPAGIFPEDLASKSSLQTSVCFPPHSGSLDC